MGCSSTEKALARRFLEITADFSNYREPSVLQLRLKKGRPLVVRRLTYGTRPDSAPNLSTLLMSHGHRLRYQVRLSAKAQPKRQEFKTQVFDR